MVEQYESYSFDMDKNIKRMIEALSDKIADELGANFVSFYVHGSLALGDFNENSDIDYVVVTEHFISDMSMIEKIHRAFQECCFGHHFEGSYITIDMALSDGLPKEKRLYYNSGTPQYVSYGYEWYFERTILIDHGLCIKGENLYSDLTPPTNETLEEAVAFLIVDTWVPLMKKPDQLSDEYIVFGVLTMCRLMYTLKEKKIISKLKSAKWMIERGYDSNIIYEAINNSKPLLYKKEAIEFIQNLMDDILSQAYINPYNFEPYIPELYDRQVVDTEDVTLILELSKKHHIKRILEPFSGTGRMMLPLLYQGYQVTGIDSSKEMVKRYRDKLNVSESIHSNVMISNVLECDWGNDYDLIILGGNCFFELRSLDEQYKIIEKAERALRNGGYLFIDHDNIEKELPESWCQINEVNKGFPTGDCEDGTRLESFVKPIYVDKKKKIWCAERKLSVIRNQKMIRSYKWIQQKHPIGYSEVINMLEKKFVVLNVWDGVDKKRFDISSSTRCTIWAKKGGLNGEVQIK